MLAGRSAGTSRIPADLGPMAKTRPLDTPSEVTAENGEVLVDGPDGLAYSMTPDAAAETSDRLLKAAAEARGQQMLEEDKAKPRR